MAKKTKEKSSAPKLGAQYQAAKLAVQIGGPPVYAAIQGKDAKFALERVKSPNYWKGAAVALADQWGSKKIGHAAALSRLSVTALLPEADATAGSFLERGSEGFEGIYDEYQAKTTGYKPQTDSFAFFDTTKRYFLEKYGLGIGRKIVNKTRIAEPVKKALSMMGVTL